jgi:thiosulfate/3-mercaptopyruvate sulfurtransferase
MGFELKPGGTTIHRAALPPFITVRELQELLRTSKTLRMIDSRAERAYDRGHLSQAVNLPARDLNPLRSGVRSLIATDRLEHKLSHLGIGREPAVIYGAKGGADAAHVWWTLHAYAHPEVYLLDGGIEAWMEAGLPLVTETERRVSR